MDTVTLTIDGRSITVEKGKTVLQAAIENGIQIPYYCYHPALGVDGSCRVCIVRVEKMPKLQTSCSTICTDGMVVDTNIARSRRGARQRVRVPAHQPPARLPGLRQGRRVPAAGLFLHASGRDASRMDFPRRVFDGEGVKGDVDFGPTLMLNRQRCILCTRCVRFMRDVDGDAQISDPGPRLRQPDRNVPGRGRPLDPEREPDGRLPGRRDHDPGLPVQVATVGQPHRGGQHLHAVREGLRDDGVAAREAGVGQGAEAGAHHAALQSRGERLLDVRHRPLRLPLRRGRRPAAQAARPDADRPASSRPAGTTCW